MCTYIVYKTPTQTQQVFWSKPVMSSDCRLPDCQDLRRAAKVCFVGLACSELPHTRVGSLPECPPHAGRLPQRSHYPHPQQRVQVWRPFQELQPLGQALDCQNASPEHCLSCERSQCGHQHAQTWCHLPSVDCFLGQLQTHKHSMLKGTGSFISTGQQGTMLSATVTAMDHAIRNCDSNGLCCLQLWQQWTMLYATVTAMDYAVCNCDRNGLCYMQLWQQWTMLYATVTAMDYAIRSCVSNGLCHL